MSPANIAKGATPIAVEWDYLNLGYKKEFKGNPNFEVTIPATGVFGNFYCDGVTKNAPHPYNCAPVAGAPVLRRGPAHLPGRVLASRRDTRTWSSATRSPRTWPRSLPPASAYESVQFPTVAQTDAANKVLAEQWGPKVRG